MISLFSPRLISKLVGLPKVNFCQMKTNEPDPIEDNNQQAQKAKNIYIQQYEARLNNVQNYKTSLASLEIEIEKINKIKNKSNNPIMKVINWLRNKQVQEQSTILRLKKTLENNREVANQLWKETQTQKTYVSGYQHKLLATNLIDVNKTLLKASQPSLTSEKVKQGIELTHRMMNMILVKYGFTPFKPILKEKFNKQLHQEVDRVRTNQPKNTIVKVVEDGWMHNQQVLVLAKVIVSE